MGRARNRKWAKRRAKFRTATLGEKIRLLALFGRHKKFEAE